MCVSTIIKARGLTVMSCVLLQSSSHESQLSCHVCQYCHQATRVSCHVMGVSTVIKPRPVSCHVMCVSIDLISITLRSYIKSRELAVMSCVLVLSSSHESQLSCHVCQYSHQATIVSCHVMCVSTVIKPRELAVMSGVFVLSIISLLH